MPNLGIPLATAIDIYLRQIAIAGGIPFSIRVAPVPDTINADRMSADEINQSLEAGDRDAISATQGMRKSWRRRDKFFYNARGAAVLPCPIPCFLCFPAL
ncbi:MAG: type II toxin-antitoxin system RelB/DinJ family antitoxin [Schwartzia sp.]|nr:type II toxin-antitoxin system RelB/DinJ family antitoxin [Schwartzia sp. (in: firmicutes)]MBR1885812.1 type II toxin-antitoxin system RelB/DinJ family antitoxin [Schwartzia sp. (in: firmicutes)]